MFEKLKSFKEEHGVANVSPSHKEQSKLGSWCQHQKQEHRKIKEGKDSSLTQEQINLLHGIGFDFTLRPWSEWETR